MSVTDLPRLGATVFITRDGHSVDNTGWSKTLVENSDFLIHHLHSTPPFGVGSPSEYCHNVWYGELERCGCPVVKKIEDMITRFDAIHERHGQTDSRTDTAWRHGSSLWITSHGKILGQAAHRIFVFKFVIGRRAMVLGDSASSELTTPDDSLLLGSWHVCHLPTNCLPTGLQSVRLSCSYTCIENKCMQERRSRCKSGGQSTKGSGGIRPPEAEALLLNQQDRLASRSTSITC